MMRMKSREIGQVHEMEIGPPLFQPAPKFVKQPARIEMIENEMAKLEKPDQLRMQLLLVAQLGKAAFVVVQLARITATCMPPGERGPTPRRRTRVLPSARVCTPRMSQRRRAADVAGAGVCTGEFV